MESESFWVLELLGVPFKKLIPAEDGADEKHHLWHDSGLRRIFQMK